ncbi:MAG: hypothetical protein JXK16_12030 [Thiotrichales bacterium]|nr:hypothetical protein [Thiotrichales bacterium]
MKNLFPTQFNLFKVNVSKATANWLKHSLLTLALAISPFTLSPLYAANLGSGLGGTGFISEDPTSGFGGTGRASSGFGGTGVIGTITEFGSIWVNGIEIGYGDKTQVTSDLNQTLRTTATRESVLKLGQQVILETLPNDDKALTKAIHLYYPLAGKITSITENGVVINGEHRVQTSEKTHYDASLRLKVGEYVAVNGYQTDKGVWQATRISANAQNREMYQPTPTKGFSDAVKKVVLETTLQQINQWQALTKLNATGAKTNARLVVKGVWQNGEVNNPQIQPYNDFVNGLMQNQQTLRPMLENRKMPEGMDKIDLDRMSMQKEQLEMMQMQRDQNSMIQDQLDQVQQIQELKDQFQQIRGLVN